MKIKYCNTCRLYDKMQGICGLKGMKMNGEIDFCSKHTDYLKVCCICNNIMLEPGYIECSTEEPILMCERCHQAYNTCQMCPRFKVCEFQTNPDPMPQVVMKTIRQGNAVMQIQVKNEERVKKFCPSCECWDENHGCMKEYNIGCYKRDTVTKS